MSSTNRCPDVSGKPRLLWVGEFSTLATGYSTYGLEVLRRLHATDKYDILEMASYCEVNDPRMADVPWKVKSVKPQKGNQKEEEFYNSHPIYEFGSWKFEEACLEHRPDATFSIRDPWMDEFIATSPYRPFFRHIYMPTVDSIPQKPDWLAQYALADALFAYSDWGAEVLRQEGGDTLSVLGSAPPGVDVGSYFVTTNKEAHKRAFGLSPDSLILGTVMRNQARKLYPDLLDAFSAYLQNAPEDIAKRALLYIHAAWPDVGWELPQLLKETALSRKVLFTYLCRNCGSVYPALFTDSRTLCKRCGQFSTTFPTTQLGVTRRALAEVMNLFDVYVQYSSNEGSGMPLLEAAACGVPVMATDYSAMEDNIRKLGGRPIRVLHYPRDPATGCKRAIPDPRDFQSGLTELFEAPAQVRASLGWKSRSAALTHCSWDETAAKWEKALDDLLNKPVRSWTEPPRLHEPATNIPEGLANVDFVHWGIQFIAGRPELVNSYFALRLLRDLNWGGTMGQGIGGTYLNENSQFGESRRRMNDFGRKEVCELLRNLAEKHNYFEALRAERMK